MAILMYGNENVEFKFSRLRRQLKSVEKCRKIYSFIALTSLQRGIAFDFQLRGGGGGQSRVGYRKLPL